MVDQRTLRVQSRREDIGKVWIRPLFQNRYSTFYDLADKVKTFFRGDERLFAVEVGF